MIADIEELAERVRVELSARSITAKEFADKAGVSESTVFRLLNKNSCSSKSMELMKRILRKTASKEELGGYSQDKSLQYLGWYRMFRRHYTQKKIRASMMHWRWNAATSALCVDEYSDIRGKPANYDDFSHKGVVYMGVNTGLLHIMTTFEGSIRLITLTTMIPSVSAFEDRMYGIILSQYISGAANYSPCVAPVFVRKMDQPPISDFVFDLGIDDPDYNSIDEVLVDVELNRVRFASLVCRNIV